MATLLRRLSLNIDRSASARIGDEQPGSARAAALPTLPSNTSFNDFSMHVGQEVETGSHESQGNFLPPRRYSYDFPLPGSLSPVRSSAPVAGRTFAASKALSIPRTSIAHVLGAPLPPDGGGASRRDSMSVASLGTPRSPLGADAAGSAPTPRASLADEPASPRSPTTPGGRRRRAQKIHGLDYYEFCELVRAGSSM